VTTGPLKVHLSPNPKNSAILFIQTVLTNLYAKIDPGLRQTQFFESGTLKRFFPAYRLLVLEVPASYQSTVYIATK